jgi:hypothetical protein
MIYNLKRYQTRAVKLLHNYLRQDHEKMEQLATFFRPGISIEDLSFYGLIDAKSGADFHGKLTPHER